MEQFLIQDYQDQDGSGQADEHEVLLSNHDIDRVQTSQSESFGPSEHKSRGGDDKATLGTDNIDVVSFDPQQF